MSYKAILFDMDGVLIESETLMTKCGIYALRDYGIDPKAEDFAPFVGCGEDRYIGGVAEKYGLKYELSMKKRCYYYFGQFVEEDAVIPERVLDLLNILHEKGYKMAVCTSSDLEKAEHNLRAIGATKEMFDVFITGDLITNKKPDPEIYLKAMNILGLQPEDCLVIEDAPNGIQAAHAGGMKAIGVASTFSAEHLKETAGPEVIIDKLIDLLDVIC